MDLSVFSPACLPSSGASFVGQEGYVYGEKHDPFFKFKIFFFSGWGDTGVQETSTDKLQETVIPIVHSSTCTDRINQTEGVDEHLILCAGGGRSGPCKVNQHRKS